MLPNDLLEKMATSLSLEECNEMAIPSYRHKNPVMRWMAYRRVKALEQWMKSYQRSVTNILDFGCGTGILLPAASQIAGSVYGVDLNLKPAQLLTEYYDLHNIHLLRPENMAAEIAERSIDLIICGDVLEHIEDLNAMLTQFRQLMKKDAHLFVSMPTENALYQIGRKLAGFSGEYHVHDSAQIHTEMIRAGFEQVRKKQLPFYGPFAIYWVIDYMLDSTNPGGWVINK
jgi:2-polyprenyl-3-methyl-5-hydroxy-6-metoxy-1,4-benzoquinol methylase